ncbi:MAG: Osmosensitive channel histidine kinase KdpD [Acidobacteria bacterium]|nr:Osmosensitive channel histidine kinase KdpD [Acidobacteriota bacterium]
MPRAPEPPRADPESLLRLARKDGRRGKLKVYLGMAAGVGKTYRMLQDAHLLRQQGVDIAVGLVETHGRAETAAVIGDLAVIPRKVVAYKGVRIEEMDYDAIVARRPDIVVIDELPHTNAPGSRQEKRWQDVEAILAAGISVMTALNVQHLEGVQDIVRSATGIDIRELVPDRIVREADGIVVIDLPVSELQERLRQGKIYAPEQAERALQNFFRTEMLSKLRELALLQTADISVGPDAGEGSTGAKIAVALPFDPIIARSLILRGSRLAGRMNMNWLGLWVRRQRDRGERQSTAEHRQLADNVQLAMSLGANVVFEESEDVVGTILAFVKRHNVALLIVGRSSRGAFARRIVPGVVDQLQRTEGFDLLIVDTRSSDREK